MFVQFNVYKAKNKQKKNKPQSYGKAKKVDDKFWCVFCQFSSVSVACQKAKKKQSSVSQNILKQYF